MTNTAQDNLLFDLDKMTPKDKRNVFETNTTELKSIIKQADSSGKAAWIAGRMLKELKGKELFKVRYSLFSKYIEGEFRINESTANTYIKIYESFDLEEISGLIVSNLKVIAEIQQSKLRKDVVKAFSNEILGDYKVKEVIATVALLDKEKTEYSLSEVQTLVKKVINKSNIEKEEEKKRRRNLVKFGEKLKSKAYPELELRFEKTPINEMGVVALFCILFDWMRGVEFFLANYNYNVNFISIKYVQTGFPDACILCQIDDKKKSHIELHIEFEYKSFEYITHKHHLSDKKCDLIICWEDSARNDKEIAKSENVRKLPPIIELKDFIETGKINLK